MTPAIAAALSPHGLTVTGAFHPAPQDGAPAGTGTLCLVGADGRRMWQVFSAAPEARDGRADPLDRWSRRVLTAAAADLGGTALFPFGGPPYAPFLAWGRRAEGARPSPVGMLVSGARGLWISWRGAIALASRLDLPAGGAADPCLGCPAPCLATCPVDALAEGPRYDVPACTAHLGTDAGTECRTGGCLARRACPLAPDAVPPRPQRAFHMAAFLAAHPPPESD